MREKKQKFRSIIGVIITITLFMLCGCNEAVNDKAVGKTTKVTIKKADGVSVYQLNADSKIQTVNTVNNRTGVNESRTYTYNNVNDLQQIKIDNSAYGISYMHYQTETQRSDGKILTKTKTVYFIIYQRFIVIFLILVKHACCRICLIIKFIYIKLIH